MGHAARTRDSEGTSRSEAAAFGVGVSILALVATGCRSRSFHDEQVGAPKPAPAPVAQIAMDESSAAPLAQPSLPLPFFPASDLSENTMFRAGVTLVDAARPLEVICNAVRVGDDAILAPRLCRDARAPRDPVWTAPALRVRTDHPAPGSQPALQMLAQAGPTAGADPACAAHLVSIRVDGSEMHKRGFKHVEPAKSAPLGDGTVWVVANHPEKGKPGHNLLRATVDVRKGADGLFDFFDAKGGRDFSVGAEDVGAAVWVSGQGNKPRLAGLVVFAAPSAGTPNGQAPGAKAPSRRARVVAVEPCLGKAK